MSATPAVWLSAFFNVLEASKSEADLLQQASLAGDLLNWTASITSIVAESFNSLGMTVAAKGFQGNRLPVRRSEYLGQDVMGFSKEGGVWPAPLAVCELENSATDDFVAYSLWKVLSVRCQLRIVFCYRPMEAEGPELVSSLTKDVIGSMSVAERTALPGETVLVVGSRNESATFPFGFFQAWKLNTNTGRFERLSRT